MSILVSIGSDPADLDKLVMAKDVTKFVSSLMKAEDHNLIFANTNYTQKQIDDLAEWLDDILYILYNGGNIEDHSEYQPVEA